MFLFCGNQYDLDRFCWAFGPSIIVLSDDEILEQAIRVITQHLYTDTIVTGTDGHPCVRRTYNNEYKWPQDFNRRVMNMSESFTRTYNLKFISPSTGSKSWIVGKDLPINQNICISHLDGKFKQNNQETTRLLNNFDPMITSCLMYLIPN